MPPVSPTNNLAYTHSEIASRILWVYEMDGVTRSTKTAKDVSAGSTRKAMIKCAKPELVHAPYKALIYGITNGKGCPLCAREARIKPKPGKSLADTHHEIASLILWVYESDGVTRSTKTAKDVSAGSGQKAMFECAKPELGHAPYKARIYNVTRGTGCPKCGIESVRETQIKPKPGKSLADTHHEIASLILWIFESDGVTRSTKTAKDVSAGSHRKAMFECAKPELGHAPYPTMIRSRAKPNGSGCPTCSGLGRFGRIEVGINDLTTTHHEIASLILWVYESDGVTRSTKTAKDVSAGSDRKAMFECAKPELGHAPYKARISSITNGQGCPLCATGKTEGLFRDAFSKHTKNNFMSARIPLERKLFVRSIAQIDMLCADLGVAVEYDGARSHGAVNNANKNITHEECIARDIDTTIALIKSGRKVIRIREHSRKEKLQFIKLPEEFASSLYQVTYKSFGKDKDDIDELVKKIIELKQDWF